MSINPANEIPENIRLAASRWLSLRESGMTEAQEEAFAEWHSSSEAHAIAFSEAEQTWRSLDAIKNMVHQRQFADVLDINNKCSGRRLRGSWISRSRWRSRIAFVPVFLASAAALAIAYLSWSRHADDSFHEESSTEVGCIRTMALPDGSIVNLNTDTTIRVDYTSTERRVLLLQGEASFKVAKNAKRPFIVTAGRVSVRAVGTAFNVRSDPNFIEVLVTEGRVHVSDGSIGRSLLLPPKGLSAGSESSSSATLDGGEKVEIPLVEQAPVPETATVISEHQVQIALGWQQQLLEFDSAPLSDVVAEFNRFNRQKLVIADPKLANMRFGGVFRPNGASALVRVLESRYGVTVDSQNNQIILRLAK